MFLVISWGMKRGIFSNEAGLGTAPMAHATTSEREPVKQALYGIFEVFMDTIIICSLTGLTLLCSGIDLNYGVTVSYTHLMLFERLYEDNVSGKIDDARFAKMSKRYEQEQGENAKKIKALRLELKKLEDKRMDVDTFLETVRRYTDATAIIKRMFRCV